MFKQSLICFILSLVVFFPKMQGQVILQVDSTFLSANITPDVSYIATDAYTIQEFNFVDLEKKDFINKGEPAIGLGFSRQRVLIRFRLTYSGNEPLYVTLSEPLNNFAHLVRLDENNQPQHINSVGYINGQKKFATKNLIYQLPTEKQVVHTYYLLADYSVITSLQIQLSRYDKIISNSTQDGMIVGILIGSILAVMLLNLFLALLTKEKELWYNFAFSIGLVIVAAILSGFSIEFLGWIKNAINIVAFFGNFAGLMSILFVTEFLKITKNNTSKTTAFLHTVFIVNYCISAGLALTPWGTSYSMPMLELGAFFSMSYFVLLALAAHKRSPSVDVRFFIIGFGSVLIFASAFVLQFWHILDPNLTSAIAFSICVLFFTFFLTVACVARIIVARQEKEHLLEEERNNLEKNVEERTKDLNLALEKVQESKQKYRLLAENTQDIVAIHDLHCNVTYVAPSIANYGYDAEKCIGKPFIDFVQPDDVAFIYALAKESAETGNSAIFEYRLKDAKNDIYAWMEGSGSVIYDAENIPTGFIITSRNIQNRKESDGKIEQYTKELERSNADLENFAHVASHDIKSPLRTVYSYLQLIERRSKDKFDETDKEYIGFIKDSVYQMNMLIDNVLSYAKIGKNIGEPKPVVVADIEQMVARNLNAIIKEKNATITWTNVPEIIKGHLPTLTQIFQNLVNNAIKYNTSPAAKVEISSFIGKKGDTVYAIKDNGIGIEERFQKTIFSMFTRLHQHNEYEGTGVGLALCSRLVDHYGGEIWVESKFGEGSTFFFTLPQTQV